MPDKRIRLNFEHLPLMEASARIGLDATLPISYEVVNKIYQRVSEDFPRITEPTVIEMPPGVVGGKIEFGPGNLPGAVFEGNPKGLSICLFPRLVIAKWAKRLSADAPTYPRYTAIRETLMRSMTAIREACDGMPAIVVTNLSYVNFVQVQNPATVVKEYFSDIAQIRALDDAKHTYKVELSWQQGEIDLRFCVEQALANVGGEQLSGYSIKTAGGSRTDRIADPQPVLDGVHDRLQSFFFDLISNKAKDEWGLVVQNA